MYGGDGREGVEGRGEKSGDPSLGHLTRGVNGGLENVGDELTGVLSLIISLNLFVLRRGVYGGESSVGVEGRSSLSLDIVPGVRGKVIFVLFLNTFIVTGSKQGNTGVAISGENDELM